MSRRPFSSFVVAGGSGNLGRPLTANLLQQGFKVTVLRRSQARSLADLPPGANEVSVDYGDTEALSAAMKGHHVVIDALSVFRNFDEQGKTYSKNLAVAASQSGIKLFVPNDFGMDHDRVERLANPPMHPFHSGHYEFRQYLAEELQLPYLGINNGLFANKGALERMSFADPTTRTARIVGGGVTPFVMTHEKDIGRFVALAFAKLSKEQLENKRLFCIGARMSWKDLYRLAAAHSGETWQWQIEDIAQSEAERTVKDAQSGIQGVITFVQLTQHTGSADFDSNDNDNDLVGFKPEVRPELVVAGLTQ